MRVSGDINDIAKLCNLIEAFEEEVYSNIDSAVDCLETTDFSELVNDMEIAVRETVTYLISAMIEDGHLDYVQSLAWFEWSNKEDRKEELRRISDDRYMRRVIDAEVCNNEISPVCILSEDLIRDWRSHCPLIKSGQKGL